MAINYAGRYGDLTLPFSGPKPGQRVVFGQHWRQPLALDLPTWPAPARLPWWRRLLNFFRIRRR